MSDPISGPVPKASGPALVGRHVHKYKYGLEGVLSERQIRKIIAEEVSIVIGGLGLSAPSPQMPQIEALVISVENLEQQVNRLTKAVERVSKETTLCETTCPALSNNQLAFDGSAIVAAVQSLANIVSTIPNLVRSEIQDAQLVPQDCQATLLQQQQTHHLSQRLDKVEEGLAIVVNKSFNAEDKSSKVQDNLNQAVHTPTDIVSNASHWASKSKEKLEDVSPLNHVARPSSTNSVTDTLNAATKLQSSVLPYTPVRGPTIVSSVQQSTTQANPVGAFVECRPNFTCRPTGPSNSKKAPTSHGPQVLDNCYSTAPSAKPGNRSEAVTSHSKLHTGLSYRPTASLKLNPSSPGSTGKQVESAFNRLLLKFSTRESGKAPRPNLTSVRSRLPATNLFLKNDRARTKSFSHHCSTEKLS